MPINLQYFKIISFGVLPTTQLQFSWVLQRAGCPWEALVRGMFRWPWWEQTRFGALAAKCQGAAPLPVTSLWIFVPSCSQIRNMFGFFQLPSWIIHLSPIDYQSSLESLDISTPPIPTAASPPQEAVEDLKLLRSRRQPEETKELSEPTGPTGTKEAELGREGHQMPDGFCRISVKRMKHGEQMGNDKGGNEA